LNVAKPHLRQSISDALNRIGEADGAEAFGQSATQLLSALGYASQKTLQLPTQPEAFARELGSLLASASTLDAARASLNDWSSVSFLFQLTDDELPALAAGQQSFFVGGGMQPHQIESFVFLALDLKHGAWSRSRLAQITRELNRLFPMPAVLLFRHADANLQAQMSVAVIHRRANKRDATRDVIESKVSIIKDVNLKAPHAAHLRILESLALSEVDDKFVPASFDALYKAWLNVLNVKALNDRFYKDLADWYYWAVLASTGVTFPPGQSLEDSTDPATKGRPTVALIRLLTRLIFVWFLKEKGLIPAALFDAKELAKLLVDAPDAHNNGRTGNYYQAILQNLFFATLNTETTDEDESGNKQRVWREASGPKRLEKYLIHTVYRYKSAFKDPDAAIALFRSVPFLNGGLFECLDKLVTPADLARNPDLASLVVHEGKQTVLRVDGFSERPENPLHIPNEIFFSDGKEVPELNTVFDTKTASTNHADYSKSSRATSSPSKKTPRLKKRLRSTLSFWAKSLKTCSRVTTRTPKRLLAKKAARSTHRAKWSTTWSTRRSWLIWSTALLLPMRAAPQSIRLPGAPSTKCSNWGPVQVIWTLNQVNRTSKRRLNPKSLPTPNHPSRRACAMP